MAVTANQLIQAQDPGRRRSYPVGGSVHIYQGTIVFLERTSGAGEGYASDVSDSGTNDFAGIAVAEADNSDGDAGDINVEVYTIGGFILVGTFFGQYIVGDLIYASDNYTVDDSSSSTTKIGACSEYVSATKIRVEIDAIQT